MEEIVSQQKSLYLMEEKIIIVMDMVMREGWIWKLEEKRILELDVFGRQGGND